VELPAQRPEAALEIGGFQVELPWNPEKRKIVAMPPERQNLAALRAEVHVHGRPAAAVPAGLKYATVRL
jgi:hypothetical protein